MITKEEMRVYQRPVVNNLDRVYLIRLNPEEWPAKYKVGMSAAPGRRLKQMQTVVPKAVLLYVWTGAKINARKAEQAALISLRTYDPGDGDKITPIGNEVFETTSHGSFMGHSGSSGWIDEDDAVADIIANALNKMGWDF